MPREHEFDRLKQAATAEIERDAKRLRDELDLRAGAQEASEARMVEDVRAHWHEPKYRLELLTQHSPDEVVHLLLRAQDVRNPDGSPMSVYQYRKTVLEPVARGLPSPLAPPPAPAPIIPPAPEPAAELPLEPAPTAPILDPASVAPAAAPPIAPEAIAPA